MTANTGSVPRSPSGDEDVVWFRDGDEFAGVDEAWLRPRLRLDPQSGEVDLFERGGLMVYLDDEPIEDIYPEDVIEGESRTLCSYGNGSIIGGGTDIVGEWLEDWAPEIRHLLTWIGSEPRDMRELALQRVSTGMDTWEPQDGDLFEVNSPFLDASRPEDIERVLAMSCEASEVTLNKVTIWPTPKAGGQEDLP